MDDIVQRSRYPRHNVTTRRRRRNSKEGTSLGETVIRQLFFAVLILLIIVIIKNLNTPVTNYLTEKIQKAISYNIGLKGLYEDVNGFFRKVTKDDVLNSDEDGFDGQAVPVSGGVSILEDTDVQGLDTSYCVGEDIILPLNGPLVSGFGDRVHPVKNTVEFHRGIDIEAQNGDLIKAVLSGVVVDAGSEPSYGKYIKVWHSPGLETVYAHCSGLSVNKGQKVKQGDIIARVGETGNVVGSHLHFEIWKDGKPENPLNYIDVPVM